MRIANQADSAQAGLRIRELLDDGELSRAIELAETCEGPQPVIDQLRALAYTHVGAEQKSRERLEEAVRLWRRAGADKHTAIAYNLANTQLELWQLAITDHGFVTALECHREHLREARELYKLVGSDQTLALSMRVQGLTNLGNSYDGMGRDIDAISTYNDVLALDPTFGMALGNKGLALRYVAPFAGAHQPTVLTQAANALDAALSDEPRVLEFGGRSALEHFRRVRAEIKAPPGQAPSVAGAWSDPYLGWCARHELFLHVSLSCVSEATPELDTLFFRGITAGLDDAEQQRAYDVIDAFNAVKQDFIAARYLLWLACGQQSPIRSHAAQVSARTAFLDTLRYGRWGVRTGLAAQAFAAATNLLDKVACAMHLYYRSPRDSRTVTFRYLWHRRTRRNHPDAIDPVLAAHVETRGLRALCDLSCELEAPTALNALVERRHSATHRFLTVHSESPIADAASSGEWLEQVEWRDLIAGAVQLLGIARSGAIYLARLIDIGEGVASQARQDQAKATGKPMLTPPLPHPRAITEHPDFDV